MLAGAVLGLLFASVSTYDFAMHLDRQVHDVHCSFVPGISGTESGASGCQVTLISSYSSVLRSSVWGGIPIALPAMGVFAFLLFFGLELVLTDRQRNPRAAGFLALATALPAVASAVMAYISLVELDAVCKLCIGIYLSSAIVVSGGVGLWWTARRGAFSPAQPAPKRSDSAAKSAAEPVDTSADPAWVGAAIDDPEAERETESIEEVAMLAKAKTSGSQRAEAPRDDGVPAAGVGYLAGAFGAGVLLVAIPCLVYMAAAPDHARFIGTCGGLAATDDPYGVMVSLDPHPGEPPAIEILDPLCPACRGFEDRLAQSGFAGEIDRRVLLFPLDKECNWMIDQSVHPGACAVSKAMLCAGDRAGLVLNWAFHDQELIRERAAADPGSAMRRVSEQFPELAECAQSAQIEARLNQSLRWAVQNRLPVLTPQLYIGGVKLCDEDVDLGLDFALSNMLAAYRAGTLRAAEIPEPEAPLQPAAAPPSPRSKTSAAPSAAPTAAPQPGDERTEGPGAVGAGATTPGDTPATGEPDDAVTNTAAGASAADKPADKPADAPADKPAGAPADKPAEQPADKPANQPGAPPAASPSPPDQPAAPPSQPAAPTPKQTPANGETTP